MYIDAAKGTFYYLDLKPSFNEQDRIVKESIQSSIRISKNIEVCLNNINTFSNKF